MKIILTLDIPDDKLAEEGVSADEIREQFAELKANLSEECPPGATITLTIE